MKYRITDDERDEFRPRQPKHFRCADGFCGADDCPRCRPENFRGGIFIGDAEETH